MTRGEYIRAVQALIDELGKLPGIGPKLGLSCLETLGADALAVAVEREDVARHLRQRPGLPVQPAQTGA